MEANVVKKTNDYEDLTLSQSGFSGTCKELPGIFRDLLTNWTFVFHMLAHVGDTLIVVGFTAFGPKYLENQFSTSAGLAAMIFGRFAVFYSSIHNS